MRRGAWKKSKHRFSSHERSNRYEFVARLGSGFAANEIESAHWSTIGDPRAEDVEIMEYARANNYVVFTHDLDFGTMLALTQAENPSIVQVRAQNILPSHLSNTVVAVLRTNQETLEKGALIVVEEGRARVRILPLQRNS
jgi:predicted nuclease of predicted toxin-antitoxin system